MPQLPDDMVESANQAASESREFKALEPGVYTARLNKVEATRSRGNPEKGTKPKPMWALEFDKVKDYTGADKPGRLWSNLTIEDSTTWKIAQFFSAFSVPTNINTDELIGHRCRLEVSKRVQSFGKNTGKEVNDIDRFAELVDGDLGFEAAQKLAKSLGGGKKAPVSTAKAAPAAAPTAEAESDADSPVAHLVGDDDSVDF